MTTIDLPCRYYRNFVDLGQTNSERNLKHAEQTLPLDAEDTALLLVDCWDIRHLDGERFDRSIPIMEEQIAPCLEAARASPVATIHCPAASVAAAYPEWIPFADDDDPAAATGDDQHEDSEWPPASFRDREDEYEAFAKQADRKAREERWGRPYRPKDSIYEVLEPERRDDEFVVATAEQLHRLLGHRGILHLLYAGFNSNFCIPYRDYGMRAMNREGYNTILLRDCTKAIEAHDTLEDELCNRIAIREIERQSGWSALSTDFRTAVNQ